jgi:hypothetical protein
MSALSIQPPYPAFAGADGLPLENGYIWIGAANLDPQGNPITIYWDAALTIPAGQPVRTLNGYPSRNGTPARLYVNSDYSIQVQNKNGSVVYSAPAATERYSDVVVTANAEDVIYDPPFTGAVQTNVEAKLAQTVSVKDFGAVGDGATDDTAAIQAAINSGAASVFVPKGTYAIASQLTLSNCSLHGEGFGSVLNFTGASGSVIYASGFVKRSISNLKITAPSLTSASGITLFDSINVSIFLVTFINFTKGISFDSTPSVGYNFACDVYNNSFTDCVHGIYMETTSLTTITNITDNLINVLGSTPTATGVSCLGANAQINIIGTTIQGGDGRAVVYDGVNALGLRVQNCWLEFSGGADKPLIQVGTNNDVKNVTITNNVIVRSTTTANKISLGGTGIVYDAVVQNNFVDGNGSYLVGGLGASVAANVVGGIISNNFWTNPAASGQANLLATAQPTLYSTYVGNIQLNKAIGLGVPPTSTGAGITFPSIPDLSTDPYTLDAYRLGSGISGASGFSDNPSGVITLLRVGDAVTVNMPLVSGTSNATTFTFTDQAALFSQYLPTSTRFAPVRVQNNGGSFQWGMIEVATTGILTVRLNPNGDAFTASGTKAIGACSFSYLI